MAERGVPRFSHETKLRCLECKPTDVVPVGRIHSVDGRPGISVRCRGCGCTWKTKSASLLRDIDLGRVKAVA